MDNWIVTRTGEVAVNLDHVAKIEIERQGSNPLLIIRFNEERLDVVRCEGAEAINVQRQLNARGITLNVKS